VHADGQHEAKTDQDPRFHVELLIGFPEGELGIIDVLMGHIS
jgi:hypothetical protein